ncbi:MAG: methyl-accepting chemotaxis protein [Pseudanabaenaceae cyanobacterium SKYGB_i_bin29]|nr:methyl-accepting chemotaxis protein [Pseudanabaenaceae cyanobacterium SKYG29]MDW8422035.1 methyl-accepting chemotaxis protein [Pseudanabaenaceae cyanobacterium SKYGB_i_bin29]
MKVQTKGAVVVGSIVAVGIIEIIVTILANSITEIAPVVNQSGLVRGGTQRLVKLKLFGGNPETIAKLKDRTNKRINGLLNGDRELGLPKINDRGYQEIMTQVQREFRPIDELVSQPNPDPKELFALSESFFETTDRAVKVAEDLAKKRENRLRLFELISTVLVFGAIILTIVLVRGIIQLLVRTTAEIASTAAQISSSMVEQEKVISQQAVSVNQTTITMEELGASSRQSAEQAVTASSSAQKSLELCQAGSESVQKTIQGISLVKDNVTAIAEKIVHLSEQTAQISAVSQLVADIANQTNILALNAAVEAARAGEQGKGFTVVAQEVRKLADQSKASAEKIGDLVKDIQASINSTVMVTDQGTKTAAESMQLAQITLEFFHNIVSAAQTISMNVQQITLSAKQQAVGVQQAVSAMNAINLGAQESASGVNQVKLALGQLSDSISLLKEQI